MAGKTDVQPDQYISTHVTFWNNTQGTSQNDILLCFTPYSLLPHDTSEIPHDDRIWAPHINLVMQK